nr:hypothetical protein [Tanacetum cinerariifolium]
MLYDGNVIAKETNVILIADSEETLMLKEESQSKMLLKQSDAMVLKQKVIIKQINYAELNRLSKDFGKRFVPQQELSYKKALHPNTDQSASSSVKLEAPRELSKMNEYKGRMPTKIELTLEQSQQGVSNDFSETYKNVSQDIRGQLNAEAEAVQIILNGIDNDIYSIVDACPNACEMWKAIERFVTLVMQNQELKTVSYYKLYDILKQHQHEVNEIRSERIARVANPLALVAQQQPVYHSQTHPTHYTRNSSTRSQQAATKNRGKAIINSPQPIYDQEPSMVTEDDETSKEKEIDKLVDLISLSINRSGGYENQRIGNVVGARETAGSTTMQKSRIQCYNCKEFRHVARECQKPKQVKDAAYHREKMLLCKQEEAGIQLNAEQADWRDDTDDDELKDQELEAHYMCMAQLQEVSPDAADSGPIFDDEPLQKVSNDAHYNMFAMESEHLEQSESVHDTYPIDQDAHNMIIDSLDMSYDREDIDQNDDDNDLANEQSHDDFDIEIGETHCDTFNLNIPGAITFGFSSLSHSFSITRQSFSL